MMKRLIPISLAVCLAMFPGSIAGAAPGGGPGDPAMCTAADDAFLPHPEIPVPDEAHLQQKIIRLKTHIARRVVGLEELVNHSLIAVLIKGHVLVESLPGAAKTRTFTTLASGIGGDYKHIPFVADMMPADILGSETYDPATGLFHFRPGPLFGNIIHGDEINRTSPRTLSALLEAMGSGEITIGHTAHELPDVYTVLATQNPHDQEGTFPLPEAAEDRFTFKVIVDYPDMEMEKRIARLVHRELVEGEAPPDPDFETLTLDDIQLARRAVLNVELPAPMLDYIVRLVASTRPDAPEFPTKFRGIIRSGAGPRASIYLSLASRAHAWIHGRSTVQAGDVDALAANILRHRIRLTDTAKLEGQNINDIIAKLMSDAKPHGP